MAVLTRQLSNPDFQQRLAHSTEIVGRRSLLGPAVLADRPEPRIPVSHAIATVLSASTGSSMRMVDIHRAVEVLLDATVPRSTVKNALATRRFMRVGHGRYNRRLLRRARGYFRQT